MLGRLADGVDFGVVGAHAVVVDDHAADVVAVWRAGEGAVVAGGEDEAVSDEDAAAVHARAGGPFGGQHGQLEKILVPGGALPAAAGGLHDLDVHGLLDEESAGGMRGVDDSVRGYGII